MAWMVVLFLGGECVQLVCDLWSRLPWKVVLGDTLGACIGCALWSAQGRLYPSEGWKIILGEAVGVYNGVDTTAWMLVLGDTT